MPQQYHCWVLHSSMVYFATDPLTNCSLQLFVVLQSASATNPCSEVRSVSESTGVLGGLFTHADAPTPARDSPMPTKLQRWSSNKKGVVVESLCGFVGWGRPPRSSAPPQRSVALLQRLVVFRRKVQFNLVIISTLSLKPAPNGVHWIRNLTPS